MVDIRVFMDSVIFLFGAIIWAMTSLYEKSASDRLSSSEAKYCCYSAAWLAYWKPAWVALKHCSYYKLLYSNVKNILKLAHVLSMLGSYASLYMNMCKSQKYHGMIGHL